MTAQSERGRGGFAVQRVAVGQAHHQRRRFGLAGRERYLAQFTALDSLMTRMSSTTNYLTQQLASLSSNS